MWNPFFDVENYSKGSKLYKIEEEAHDFWIVKTGAVEIKAKDAVRVIQVGRGALVGELDFLLDRRRTLSAACVEDVKAWRMTRDSFQRLQKERPDLAVGVLRVMVQDLALVANDLLVDRSTIK